MHLLAVSIGNTRTRLGVFRGKDLDRSHVVDNTDTAALIEAAESIEPDRADAPVVIASVNDQVADALEDGLRPNFAGRVHRFGRDLTIPIRHSLPDISRTGQDRLLGALAAHARTQQACVVIDAGTAITVDFVDGEGVYHGGAIAPGVRMMLRSLHEHTAALPDVEFPRRRGGDASPFGQDTASAMILGVRSAAVGMARLLIDRYAEAFGAYPVVVATGGDAPSLFEGDPLVERIVPDLVLLGIHAACEKVMEEGE
ncbi:MAG: type III pantothenate kinase [Phycisphaerales bacterium]|nr:type III pantothenate kinase [Phycisphaerales bacterium]